VKNAVFLDATRQNLNVDDLYEGVWKPQLDDEYWREERRQGRLYRPRAELFLMHWLGMKLRRVIPATELFSTFRKDILQAPERPRADHLIQEMCRDARILRSFDNQPANSVEALFFQRLETLDITVIMPLVLLLFREQSVSVEARRRALASVESWLVRRTLMRLTTKNYNEQIPVLLAKVATDPARADEIVREQLSSGAGDISRWPGDGELMQYLETHDAYGNIAQARLVMVLGAIERWLCKQSRAEVMDLPKGLSIEHMMPQSWEESWPLPACPSPVEQAEAVARREERIHRLGNLTLTTQPVNSGMSNGPWPEKKQWMTLGSKLLLNSEILERWPEVFVDSDIDGRTSEQARRICSIWPGPQIAS
jgi:hypothetical protein